MIRSFVFSQGKVVSQDVGMDVLRLLLYDEGVQIWVDAENPTAEETKTLLEGVFNFHPLAIEDCIAVSERPKVDDYESYLFMVIHGVDYSQAQHGFQTKELNLFIGKNFLVTAHNEPMKSVSSIIERVTKNAPLVARAADRLTYNLLGALLDNYEPALENLSTEVAELESAVVVKPSKDVLNNVLEMKTQVQGLRQIIAPQREVIARLAHGEFKVVRTHLLPYYRDLLDHLSRISDQTDNYRDALTNILQVHLNIQQMQINRVIKVLTILATLATPVLLITSFYGMNVGHVPNLDWPWWQAYPTILGVTGIWTLGLYLYLRRRGWW